MRVLNVDDSRDNLYFVERVLRSAGFEVVNAHDGVEALEILERENFDLIVSDVLMPRMDGFRLCRAVRNKPATTSIPFVLYSGSYTDAKDISLATRLGANRYLIKPMEPNALLAALQDAIKNPGHSTPAKDPVSDDDDYLRHYSERVAEKLELKVMEYNILCEKLQAAFDEKVREVADRLKAEEALRRSEERYRSVVDSLAEGIILADDQGNLVACNESAAHILGVPRSRILASRLSQSLWNVVQADGPVLKTIEHPLRRCLDTGIAADSIEFGHSNIDEQVVWLSANVRPCVRDGNGRVMLAVMSFSDITEKKSMEEKFMRAQRLESIGILAGGVAHDLNNILSPILLGVPIVRMRTTDAHLISLLDTMEASANRGAQIVRQILNFSRGMTTEKINLQPRHLIKEIAELAMETFPRTISIETDVPRTLWQVEADATQMHQVYMNLCVNARDAMPDGGLLLLRAENVELSAKEAAAIPEAREGSYVKLSVGDTGCGMSAEVQARIFQPFFTTKEVGKGTGLGLSTARGIILRHNGFMTLESQQGEGSRFDIYLPAIKSEETDHPSSGEKPPVGNGELIMVVDDEYALRKICENVLSNHGYRVVLAENGMQGVSLLREQAAEIALVITDIIMPGMSGSDFLSMAKSLKPGLKSIAISGTGAPSNESHAPAGVFVDAFISKPFSAPQLLTAVYQLLNERE